MLFNWGGKLPGRTWVRTISQGITQIFTRILGTTFVAPASPRIAANTYTWRVIDTPTTWNVPSSIRTFD